MNNGDNWELIRRAIEDAERMIYFASQGKTEEKVDLACLEALVQATVKTKKDLDAGRINEQEVAHFFKQLSLMSHILYPVTSESLRVMAGMALQPCAAGKVKSPPYACIIHLKNIICSSPMLLLLAAFTFIVSLVVTPYVFNYAAKGATIMERLDATLKERAALNQALTKEAHECKPDSNNDIPYDTIALARRLEWQKELLISLLIQLEEWNSAILGEIITLPAKATAEQSPPSTGPVPPDNSTKTPQGTSDLLKALPDKGKSDNCTNFYHKIISEMPPSGVIKKNMLTKNNGLLILQTINNCIILLLFGCCGASAYVWRKAMQEIRSHSFTGIRWTTWIRILLGTFSGFFLGYLAGTDLSHLLSLEGGASGAAPVDISLVSPLTLAFIGGYSVDLLFSILNRFIYAVTNDERYLPSAELMKRKVDVNKLITPNDSPTPIDSGQNGTHVGGAQDGDKTS